MNEIFLLGEENEFHRFTYSLGLAEVDVRLHHSFTGLFGLGMVIATDLVITIFGWPLQDQIILGIVGSVYITFGLLSILALRSPLKFVPILLLQLYYKIIWFLGVALPFVG